MQVTINSISTYCPRTTKNLVTLPTLPHLEQLTIRATLHYIGKSSITEMWGCYSPGPCDNCSLAIRHLSNTLALSQAFKPGHLYPSWPPFINNICIRVLGFLLRCVHPTPPRSFINNNQNPTPVHLHYSLLSNSKELMQFVEQCRLIVTPPVPTPCIINSWITGNEESWTQSTLRSVPLSSYLDRIT